MVDSYLSSKFEINTFDGLQKMGFRYGWTDGGMDNGRTTDGGWTTDG